MSRYQRTEDSFYQRLGWVVASFVFALAAYGLYYKFVMNAVQKAGNDIIENSNKASQRIVEKAQKAKEEQEALKQEAARRDADVAQAQLRAQQLVNEKIALKEKAWKKFYKPSKKCIDDPVSVDCANAHIRAKGNFEETYKYE